ncbi:MAG TPA: cell division protein FtsL [Bacillota bacterium]|nr:cell division protein FtsL [Bacillota bacterium]
MNTERARNWRNTYSTVQPQVEQQRKVKVIVRRRSWITKGEKVIYSFIGIALVIACYFIVSFSAQTDQMNRDIQSLEQTINNQRVHNENLQFKIDELSKPDRIMAIAEKLGLKIQDTKVKRAQLINE